MNVLHRTLFFCLIILSVFQFNARANDFDINTVKLSVEIIKETGKGLALEVKLLNISTDVLDYVKSQYPDPLNLRVWNTSGHIINLDTVDQRKKNRWYVPVRLKLAAKESRTFTTFFSYQDNALSTIDRTDKYHLQVVYPLIRLVGDKYKVLLIESDKIELFTEDKKKTEKIQDLQLMPQKQL